MCVKMVMKIVSGLLSLVFTLLGIAFLVVGCILQFGLTTVVVHYIKTYTDQLNAYLAQANAQFDVNAYIGYLPQITGNLAIPFIVMGVVIAAIGIIGLIAICCENKLMLVIYIAILSILIAGQLALIITYYAARPTFVSRAKTYMQQTIDSKFTGIQISNMETILWNVFHLSLQCCGIQNGNDFASAAVWNRTVSYNGTTYDNIAYPMTCCKVNEYKNCLDGNHTDVKYTNWNVGCWDKIDNVVQLNIVYAALGTAGIVLLQVLILVFAVHLCRGDKGKTEKV